MSNSIEQVNSFLDKDYAKNSQILRNGDLFTAVHREEANVVRAIENLQRVAENQQKQQAEAIKRKYQVKTDSLQSLLDKLNMYLKNPAMLNSDDITMILSMLGEMHQLLESQKDHEIQISNNKVDSQSSKAVEEYKERTRLVIEKHLEEAHRKLDSIQSAFKPLENYYETASFDSAIWDDLKNDYPFPVINQIRLGEEEIKVVNPSEESISYVMPVLAPFFNRNSLTIVYKNGERDKLKNLIDSILTRCLMSAEAGNILFHFMDGNGNGSLFFDYLKCSNKTLQLFDGKLNVSPQEIDGCMQKLMLTYKEIDQKIRKGEPIVQYNKNNPKSRLPYHLVVMDSFPKGVSSSYLPLISRWMNDELEAGLHFIFLVEEQDLPKVASILASTFVYRIPDNYVIRKMGATLQKVLLYVDENFTKEKTMLFEEYYKNVQWWQGDASNYTRIPLGLSYANNYNLIFNEEGQDNGVASAHAVIVGMSGSGKSSLLNTMIMGASMIYSPNELRFYLIDMKLLGFEQYAKEKLPHAEMIALKANPEFGLHTLRNIEKKLKERNEYFRSKGADNFYDFRRKYPNEIMPRYMIFIDEYQELLTGETRSEVAELLNYILRISRALGYNLILSSQSMHLTDQMLLNVSHRIVLRCSTDIGRITLGVYDERAPKLNKGQAIIHCEHTDVVQDYFLPKDESEKPKGAEATCRSYLQQINQKWQEKTNGTYNHRLVVFGSEMPALLSNNMTYRSLTIDNETANKELLFSPGEKYMVDGTDFMCRLVRNKNENILVVGGKLQVSTRTANTTFISMLPQLDPLSTHIDIVSYQDRSEQFIYDHIRRSSDEVCKKFSHASFHEFPQDISPLLDSLVDDITKRKELASKGTASPVRLFVVYRTDANPQFQKMEVEGRLSTKYMDSEQSVKLKHILNDGPEVGVFCLLHFDNTTVYTKIFSDGEQTCFNHRILLQMSEDQSKMLLQQYRKDANQLVDNEASEKNRYNMAIYKNAYENSEPVRLKPYEFLNLIEYGL